jgi:hypothetical protein
MTGTKGARLLPLPSEVAIDQIRSIADRPTETRMKFFQERQLPRIAQMEERATWQNEQYEKIRDGVAAVSAAIRLLRWRRRRLERLLTAHADTAVGKSSS